MERQRVRGSASALAVGLLAFAAACAARPAAAKDTLDSPVRWHTDGLVPEFVQQHAATPEDFLGVLRSPWSDGPAVVLKDLLNVENQIWQVKAPARDNDIMMWVEL